MPPSPPTKKSRASGAGGKGRGAPRKKAKASSRSKRSASSGSSGGLRRFLTAVGGVAALGLTLGTLWLGMLYLAVVVEVKDRMSGQRWELPTKLYAQPLALQVGEPAPAGDFGDLLSVMGYQKQDRVQRSGEFRSAGGGRWYVFPYDPPKAGKFTVSERLDISLAGGRIKSLTNYDTKKRLTRVELPGLPFAEIHQGANEARRIYDLADFPEYLRNAVVAIEDERYYSHGALDPIGIARALFVNVTAGAMRQGGSTLTQQVAKNFFLTQERTLSRKLKEVLYSVALERNYSKDAILEVYLNEIYLGQNGSIAICGMGEAAYHYFSRKPSQLSVAEAALLAGMIHAPNALNPLRHAEKASERRDRVLAKMAELGFLSEEQRAAAAAEAVVARPGRYALKDAPWFVDQVISELSDVSDAPSLAGAGFAVRTTLDWRVQRAAEHALERGLARLGKKDLQGAVVVLDPRSGHVLALVGGRDWQESQFNRALSAHRQPGSAFKPIVFAAAFRSLGQAFGPTFILKDEAITLTVDKGVRWSPSNFEKTFSGEVSARTTLERSINAATVDLAQQVGLETIVQTARLAGLDSACAEVEDRDGDTIRDCDQSNPTWKHPSLALGSKEVTPLELARAYTAIAVDGRARATASVLEVLDSQGDRVYGGRSGGPTTVIPADAAWMLRDMLAGVVDEGTARSVRANGYNHRAYGKTGTTNEERDAWFVGFDKELLAVVWVGYDDNRPTGLTGGRAAAPIWADLMKEVRRGRPPPEDPAPPTITLQEVCTESFELASRLCPTSTEEVFFTGHLPAQVCHIHGRPLEQTRQNVRSWLERLFGGKPRIEIQINGASPDQP